MKVKNHTPDPHDMAGFARRNLRSFLQNATFRNDADRQAALVCLEVLEPDTPAPAEDVPKGYDSLYQVLRDAFDQASVGKGAERHASGAPFTQQPMQKLIDLYGPGFALGQAGKKMQESQRMDKDAAKRELLGAIVYIAGAIVHLENSIG